MINKKRLDLIDLARGLAVLLMIIYHVFWDFFYIFNIEEAITMDLIDTYIRPIISYIFIFVSGLSWQLSRKHLKKGALLILMGSLISLITYIIMPKGYVKYGILTFIGSMYLIFIVIDQVLRKVDKLKGVLFTTISFILLRIWTNGYPITIPDKMMDMTFLKEILAYIGFPQAGFKSLDYFPIIPWIFLFSLGYFLYGYLSEKGYRDNILGTGNISFINFIGRHSLIIYLVHQPICFTLVYIIYIICYNFT